MGLIAYGPVVVGLMQSWCGGYRGRISSVRRYAVVDGAGEGVVPHCLGSGPCGGGSTSVYCVVGVCGRDI